MNYEIFNAELTGKLAEQKNRMEWEALQRKWDLDYGERKRKYEMECELLRIKRDQFLAANPDHPFKDIMFLQVTAPPQKLEIRFI